MGQTDDQLIDEIRRAGASHVLDEEQIELQIEIGRLDDRVNRMLARRCASIVRALRAARETLRMAREEFERIDRERAAGE